VTGYIAGDALHLLHEKHPDWDYTCLVRTEDKAKTVKEAYPNVKIVLGDLEASSILEEQAAKADIVLRKLFCRS
jgi:N-acetyl-gamma-glutamylphosphate reductase